MTDTPELAATPPHPPSWATCPGDCHRPRLVVGVGTRKGPRIRQHDARVPSASNTRERLGRCSGSGAPVPPEACRLV